jgi:hypothetical protein
MPRKNLRSIVYLLVAILSAAHMFAQISQTPQAQRAYAKASLPMAFEANRGQVDPQAKFLSRGKGYTAYLTAGGMVLSLRPAKPLPAANITASKNISGKPQSTTLQFSLVGAAKNPAVVGEAPLPGSVNYFLGKDPTKWRTHVPTYAKVRFKNVYPGVDLIYYGNNRQLEYDFAVSPGADPSQIQFNISGANQVELDAQGNLVLQTANGDLHFQTPVIYQETKNLRAPIKGSYVLNDATHIGFRVAQYDPNKPLVIDPVLVYSTYLGGSGDDEPAGIAVDTVGNIYVAGYTDSTDFPLATLGSIPAGTDHVFVAKLDPTGSSLIYADYIGGSGEDYGLGLVLDSSNEVYVTGNTSSGDFPVVNPYQGTYPGGANAFLTKISSDGSSLLYSTYLGGNGSDSPAGVAIDISNEVLVAGSTTSTNFPVASAYQSTVSANEGGVFGTYGFLTKFSADGSYLVYSTYLAGNSNTSFSCGNSTCWPSPSSAINGITLDGSGNAYVGGITNTLNFPTSESAYQATNSTTQDSVVGFVSKFSGAGALGYSTYFYESSGNLTNVNAIAVDSAGSAYVSGIAYSDGTFPITSTSICDPNADNCSYAFVTKFDPAGSTLLYSTFLGPNNFANPQTIALDANNDAYVLSSTYGSSFNTVNAIEPYTDGSDLLLVEIDPLASTQLFATYLGGSGQEYPAGIALDSSQNIYIAASTDSTDFPVTTGALQNIEGGGTDGLVLKIGPSAAAAVATAPGQLQFSAQEVGSTSSTQSLLLQNLGSAALSISSITTTGDFAETDDCGTSVPAAGSCTFSVTFTPTAGGLQSGSIVIQDNAASTPVRPQDARPARGGAPQGSQTIALSGNGSSPAASAVTLNPTSLAFAGQQMGTTSSAQTVTVANSGNATLNISGIQVSGDFAQTNTCPTQLTAGSSCTVNVTFSPTVSGTRSGSLTLTDDAAGSPQNANLTGSGVDFTLTSSPGSDTIKAGATANYSLTVSPVGGSFAYAITLACSGAPAGTSCTVTPSTVTPGANPATSTLLIATVASSARLVPAHSSRSTPVCAVWMQLQGLGFLGMIVAASSTRLRKLKRLALLALLGMALVSLTACAGGTGVVAVPPAGTTSGTYTVTVTATSSALQHSVPLTLTVQ